MLQSLDLFGFKSFADKVRFDFDPGITCVVGPNGSGKSNVVDGIKWLLGDQSAKSLRGSEMMDVVFNGSASRGPSGYAEAVLTFDNSSGAIPYAAREIAVGRRLYRTGESEYLLNGEAVRLKDVRGLFMGTGAGSAAYSIIEQGRVGQILQANPAARRAVFEEAAGVSKFRLRRAEAERRLARVAQNLDRLTDIVDETEVRLAATRSQASKAAKYRELTKELRASWLGLAGDQARRLGERVDQIDAALTADAETAAKADARLSQIAADGERLTSALADAQTTLAAAEAEQSERRQTVAGLGSKLESLAELLADGDVETRRLRSERASEQRRRDTREAELSSAIEEAAAAADAVDAVDTREAAAADAVAAAEVRRGDAHQAVEESDRRVKAADAAKVEADARRRVCEAQLKHSETAVADLDRKIRDDVAAEKAAAETVETCRRAVAEVRRDQTIVRDRLSDLRSEEATLLTAAELTRHELRDAREERTAAEARLAVLTDLEPQASGYAVGVEELLRRGRESGTKPWSDLRGRVGDLLDCDVRHAPLLDLALGERAHLIVTDDIAALMAELQKRPVEFEGRVGFIQPGHSAADAGGSVFETLDAFYRSGPRPDLSGEAGVIARADTLVHGAEALAGAVLGDTWLVETLEVARRVRTLDPHARAVTTSGELIGSDGSLHVGTIPITAALIGRRTEVRELRRLVTRLDRDIQQLSARDGELSARRDRLRQQIAEAATAEPDALEKVGQKQTDLITAVDRCEAIRLRLDGLRGEASKLDEDHQALASQVDEETSSLRRETDAAARAADEARIAEAARDTAAKEYDAHAAHLRDVEREAMTLRAAHTTAVERAERLGSEVADVDRRLAAVDARRRDLFRRRRDVTLQLLNARARRDAVLVRCEAAESDLISCQARFTELKTAAEAHREESATLRQQASELAARRESGESARREAIRDLQRLAERCEEDFGLTLDDAAAEPSAYEAFCVGLPEDVQTPTFEEVESQLEQDTQRLRRKIKALGSVNTDALADLDEMESRYETLSAQLADLTAAKATLDGVIDRVNVESRRRFAETFETVRGHFRELFRKCFGGGSADLVLEETDDVLDAGIEIMARPPGKEPRNLSLLSGGEKAMTAVALLMALFRAKPSPYCILDEVDAPLDEANIDRFLNVLREFRENTQFIVITHRRRTMTAADVIYGVTMEQSGISKKLAVSLEQVADDGAVRQAA